MRYRVKQIVEIDAPNPSDAIAAAEQPITDAMKRQPSRLPGIVSTKVVKVEEV